MRWDNGIADGWIDINSPYQASNKWEALICDGIAQPANLDKTLLFEDVSN